MSSSVLQQPSSRYPLKIFTFPIGALCPQVAYLSQQTKSSGIQRFGKKEEKKG